MEHRKRENSSLASFGPMRKNAKKLWLKDLLQNQNDVVCDNMKNTEMPTSKHIPLFIICISVCSLHYGSMPGKKKCFPILESFYLLPILWRKLWVLHVWFFQGGSKHVPKFAHHNKAKAISWERFRPFPLQNSKQINLFSDPVCPGGSLELFKFSC